MSKLLERLALLAELDNRLKAIDEEDRAGPARIRVAEARAKTLRDQHAAAVDAAKHKSVDAHKLEVDIKTREEQIAKYRAQQSGAKSNKEYDIFKQQIETVRKAMSEIETQALQVMEEADAFKANAQAVADELKAAEEPVARLKKDVADAHARLSAEAAQLRAKRASLTEGVDGDVLAAYEMVLKRYGRGGLARCDGGVCAVCGLRITVQDLQMVRMEFENRVIPCKSCGRILYLGDVPAPQNQA
jgi:uncharacterized protein